MDFNINYKYNFKGDISLIEDYKLNDKTTFLYLGNFICYLDIPLWGDIIICGKAKFENGIINSNYFNLVEDINN